MLQIMLIFGLLLLKLLFIVVAVVVMLCLFLFFPNAVNNDVAVVGVIFVVVFLWVD